jgi:hypothetical protein
VVQSVNPASAGWNKHETKNRKMLGKWTERVKESEDEDRGQYHDHEQDWREEMVDLMR